MNTIRIYIDEKLDAQQFEKLNNLLMDIAHVNDVEYGKNDPHELTVEYDEHHDMPIQIIEVLRGEGYHPDILSG